MDKDVMHGIFITDPEGVTHLLGLITESHDYAECGEEFITVAGWKGRGSTGPFCAKCIKIWAATKG